MQLSVLERVLRSWVLHVPAEEPPKTQNREDVPQALERYEQVFRPATFEEIPYGSPQIVMPQTAGDGQERDCIMWIVSKPKVYKLFRGGSRFDFKMPPYDWVDT